MAHPSVAHPACEKIHNGYEAEVRMSEQSLWQNNLTEGDQLHQQNAWNSEHILCPFTLCLLNALQTFESCRHITWVHSLKTDHGGFHLITEQLHHKVVIPEEMLLTVSWFRLLISVISYHPYFYKIILTVFF